MILRNGPTYLLMRGGRLASMEKGSSKVHSGNVEIALEAPSFSSIIDLFTKIRTIYCVPFIYERQVLATKDAHN